MLDKYEKHLKKLNKKVEQYFEDQKEFIKCKVGCSYCCTVSYYPTSELEYKYIKKRYELLDEKLRMDIQQKALDIIKARNEFLKTNTNILDFSYVCPFLVNNSCCIYSHRPMVCRAHGLIANDPDNHKKLNLPDCSSIGLNYAEIWQLKNNNKNDELDELFNANLKSYDLSYADLIKNDDNIEFGDYRMIVEWIAMDIPNFEKLIKRH